jgi:hypothetical protein
VSGMNQLTAHGRDSAPLLTHSRFLK